MKNREVVKYNKGKENKIAFVFSCPGQLEQIHDKLVFGKTGENLEILLRYLKQEKFIEDNFNDRYDFRITNSSDKVHYKKLNNRTEPLISEIKKEENINRLIEELKDITDTIICFGKRPETTLRYIWENHKDKLKAKKVLYSRHLGLMSLNQIKLKEEFDDKTKERIRIVAEKLIEDYKK